MRLALALVCLPFAATAQSLDFDGSVAIGATDAYAGHAIGAVDATVALPLWRRWPLTFELGVYMFVLDGKRPHETYAAFVWNDAWRLGVVRPAYDSVLPSVFEQHAPYLAYARAEYARAHATTEAMRRTAVPWGVSYSRDAGELRYVVSAHDAIKGQFRSASVGMEWARGPWQLAAAVEGLWDRQSNYHGVNAKLGARYDFGTVEAGLAYLHPEANTRPDAVAVDIGWAVSDTVTLAAFGEFTDGGLDDAYGLSVDYAFRPETSVSFAATDGAVGNALHLTLAQRF